MVRSLLAGVEATLRYVQAGDALDRGDYDRGRAHIDEAIRLLGAKAEKPALFYVHMRAAMLQEKLGRFHDALQHVDRAMNLIEAHSRLRQPDRLYLLDFCDVVRSEMTGKPAQLRLRQQDHSRVSPRYRREYPLLCNQGLRTPTRSPRI